MTFPGRIAMLALVLCLMMSCWSGCHAAEDLPRAVFESLKTGNAAALEPLLAGRDDYRPGTDSNFHESPPGEDPARSERAASASRAFEQAVAQRLAESMGRARSYGEQLSFDWRHAVLERILARTVGGSETEYRGNKEIGFWLTLEIRSGDKRVAVIVGVRPTKKGLRLTGNLVASALSERERKALSKWQPGFDLAKDRQMAQFILGARTTEEWFSACSLTGMLGEFAPGYNLQMPAFFDAGARDEVWLVDDGRVAVLRETGPGDLKFSGAIPVTIPLTLESRNALAQETITVTFKSNDVMDRKKWSANVNGRDREFTKLTRRARAFRSPSARTLVFGKTEIHHHTVEVTFLDGIAGKVVVDGDVIQ